MSQTQGKPQAVFAPLSVELTKFVGGDENHALSAWTSTSRDLNEEKRGRIHKLIGRLFGFEHHTPFEKSYIEFDIRSDIATHIHFLKHRVGVSINTESARYKTLKDIAFHIPEDWPEAEKERLSRHCRKSFRKYLKTKARLERSLKNRGVSEKDAIKRAKETSRYYLPYSAMLRMNVAFNFRSFAHFQLLRNSPHAQVEVRRVAQMMLEQLEDTGKFKWSIRAMKGYNRLRQFIPRLFQKFFPFGDETEGWHVERDQLEKFDDMEDQILEFISEKLEE